MPVPSPLTFELFDFLSDLQRNNRREWFAEQKQRYIEEVLNPSVELCSRLQEPLRKVSSHLRVKPAAHRGSVMRIYRDTRFTRDKSPFKTNVGISIRHLAADDIHAPGLYLHLEPRNCFIGCGCWKPDRISLSMIRDSIVNRSTAWKRTVNEIQKKTDYILSGEKLKRGPRDLPKDHPLIEDLKRTDFILIENIPEQALVDSDPVPFLIDRFTAARPWMRFLCQAMHLKY